VAFDPKMLYGDEQIVLDTHPSWVMMTRSVLYVVGATVAGVLLLRLGGDGVLGTLTNWVAFALIVLALLHLATHFVLTSDRVIFRTGIIAKHGIEIPLERINTIFFHQRIFERMLGLGDLDIESASKDGAQRFEDIRNPSAVQNEIYQQMEANQIKNADRISGGINRAHGATESIPDQIAKLSALRDQGVLTEDEFQAKKQDLLGRM